MECTVIAVNIIMTSFLGFSAGKPGNEAILCYVYRLSCVPDGVLYLRHKRQLDL